MSNAASDEHRDAERDDYDPGMPRRSIRRAVPVASPTIAIAVNGNDPALTSVHHDHRRQTADHAERCVVVESRIEHMSGETGDLSVDLSRNLRRHVCALMQRSARTTSSTATLNPRRTTPSPTQPQPDTRRDHRERAPCRLFAKATRTALPAATESPPRETPRRLHTTRRTRRRVSTTAQSRGAPTTRAQTRRTSNTRNREAESCETR